MMDVIPIFMAFFASVGFAVMYQVRGYKILLCGLGGSLTWAVYLLVVNRTGDEIAGFFAATMLISLVSEVLARVVKTPVIMFLVPMLIPLIPGGNLYESTTYLIQNQMGLFGSSIALLLRKVGAIAFGIIFVASLVQIYLTGKRAVQTMNHKKR